MVAPIRCSLPSLVQAKRMARISAWAVGSWVWATRLGLCKDVAVPDDYRGEGPSALSDVLTGDIDGALGKVHGCLIFEWTTRFG